MKTSVTHMQTRKEAISFKVLARIPGYHLVKLWFANGTTITEWYPA